MIGITGREAGMTIVTHNQKHFNRIEGIKTEDWTK
jgi:predicted nucleic acid-binding protein